MSQKTKHSFTENEINRIRELVRQLEKATPDKQKGIRAKIRNIGLYWSEVAPKQPYTIENLNSLIEQRKINISLTNNIQSTNKPKVYTSIEKSNPSDEKKIGDSISNNITNSQNSLKQEEARENYKPENIKLLFIAEAPPEDPDRFFYFENVPTNDWLYLAIAKNLFGDKDSFLFRQLKPEYLKQLKQSGIYLMDLSSTAGFNEVTAVNDFMERIEKENNINKDTTKIILIKANVYDCLYRRLKNAGYNVIDKRLPFPASGQQKNFATGMEEIRNQIPNEILNLRK